MGSIPNLTTSGDSYIIHCNKGNDRQVDFFSSWHYHLLITRSIKILTVMFLFIINMFVPRNSKLHNPKHSVYIVYAGIFQTDVKLILLRWTGRVQWQDYSS